MWLVLPLLLLGVGVVLGFARLPPLGDVLEPRQEVIPPLGVARDRTPWKPPMDQAQPRTCAFALEGDLDGARAGRHDPAPLPAPGGDEPPPPDPLHQCRTDDDLGAGDF